MNDEQTKQIPSGLKWVFSDETTPNLYGNVFNVSWTLYDVRFQIGRLVPAEPGVNTEFIAEEQGSLTVSWAQAKMLRDGLIDLVRRYELANGEIAQPKLPSNEPLSDQ